MFMLLCYGFMNFKLKPQSAINITSDFRELWNSQLVFNMRHNNNGCGNATYL